MVNAVNLTDGLDGLAAGSASFNLVFFIVAAAIFTSNDAGVAAASLLGACASFLYYNLNPVFGVRRRHRPTDVSWTSLDRKSVV